MIDGLWASEQGTSACMHAQWRGTCPPACSVASRSALRYAKNAIKMRLVDVVDPRLAQIAPTIPARQLVLRQLFHLSPVPRHDLVIIVVNVGVGSNEGDEGPA